jgi:hypothetical protein
LIVFWTDGSVCCVGELTSIRVRRRAPGNLIAANEKPMLIKSTFRCFGIHVLDARQTARSIQLIEDGSDGNFLNSRAQIAVALASEEIGYGRLEHDIAALFARLP